MPRRAGASEVRAQMPASVRASGRLNALGADDRAWSRGSGTASALAHAPLTPVIAVSEGGREAPGCGPQCEGSPDSVMGGLDTAMAARLPGVPTEPGVSEPGPQGSSI